MGKKIFRGIVAGLLAVMMLLSLTACQAKLKGTYTAEDGLIKQSFTFSKDGKVEVSAFGINVEGDYVIEDGEITITYSLLGLKYDMVKSFEKKGKSIFIDGQEFVKE